jgi:hypothetical protein
MAIVIKGGSFLGLHDAAGLASLFSSLYISSTIADIYPNSAWRGAFIGGNHEFLVRNLDAGKFLVYYAAGIISAMAVTVATATSTSAPLDGGKTYTVQLRRTFRRRTSGRSSR